MDAISIQNLKKTYKNGVKALKGIDLTVKQGDFFGLIGQNGAGKTTIIGIVTDLVKKTEGEVRIFDLNIDTDFNEAKHFIGVVPQEMNFNIFEKVEDIVVNQGGYYGLPNKIACKRAEKYLKQLGLWGKRREPSGNLSGGMKRRLMIARSLVHEPKLLILDEPTAGVDVELRRGMWDFLTKLNKKGVTIILTTHYLEEAERLCNHICIIDKGKIVENSPKKELLKKLDKETIIFDLKTPMKIKPLKGYKIKQTDDNTVEVDLLKNQDLVKIIKHFDSQGAKISSMTNKTNRLEELFLDIVKGGKK